MSEHLAGFQKVLDPSDRTTGGGTASAIAGAMAGSLVAMVAHLSISKEGLKDEVFYSNLAKKAQELSDELIKGGDEDYQSFAAVNIAYKMPKESAEEKAARDKKIQAGWIHATHVPLANAERCLQILVLADQLREAFNKNAVSDLDCAVYLAKAGVKGCISNVEINLPSIKDQQTSEKIVTRKSELVARLSKNRDWQN